MTTAQLLQLMAQHILKNTPPGRPKDWRYWKFGGTILISR
jgi:hypothetical protein